MIHHLPILQVILPLLAAPACLIINSHRWVWLFTLCVGLASLLVSIALLTQVTSSGPISYALGGWEAPWGIEYRIDILNSWVLLIVCIFNVVALLPAYKSIGKELQAENHVYFYTLYLLCFAGLLGITATGDVFNIFVFLEISSLSTYALIALGSNRRALWASYQYLIIGTIGASFILIGIGLLYIKTGTLNMQDLAIRIPLVAESKAIMAAMAFILVGICMKLALFPLHAWLPNAYAYAPSVVTIFIAATATKVAIYLLIRFLFSVFGIELSMKVLPLQSLFLCFGFLGVFIASILAITQSNVKKMFAYSSVAQIGYMVVGLGIGSVLGLQATLLHLFNHALIKGGLFLALAGVMYQIGKTEISDFKGLGARMPWTTLAIVVGGLSLIGVPLTAGFVSKWYLVLGALDANLWPVAFLIVLGSVLAVVYVWRLVEQAYFSQETAATISSDTHSNTACEAPLAFLIPIWILVLANVYFGIDTRLTVSVSELAATWLFGLSEAL